MGKVTKKNSKKIIVRKKHGKHFKDLRAAAIYFQKELKKIKVFLMDIDGVLSNGELVYDGETLGFNRFFHALDGYGVKMLKQAGIKVGVISGGDGIGIRKRLEYLNVDYAFLGNEDKRPGYLKILEDGYKDEEISFIGDDFIDLPILKRVGFAATVPGSSLEIQDEVDYVTTRACGDAPVRELIDLLRYAQGIKPKIEDF